MCNLSRKERRVAARPDTYLLRIPSMPAMIPRIPPAKNPPPMTKLSTANGNVINAPIGPRLISIMKPPVIIVNPVMRPMRKAIDCPKPDGPPNHQNIPDQLVGAPQKPGESNAAAFTSISTADAIAKTKAQIALLPENVGSNCLETTAGPATKPAPTIARLCLQYGQYTT